MLSVAQLVAVAYVTTTKHSQLAVDANIFALSDHDGDGRLSQGELRVYNEHMAVEAAREARTLELEKRTGQIDGQVIAGAASDATKWEQAEGAPSVWKAIDDGPGQIVANAIGGEHANNPIYVKAYTEMVGLYVQVTKAGQESLSGMAEILAAGCNTIATMTPAGAGAAMDTAIKFARAALQTQPGKVTENLNQLKDRLDKLKESYDVLSSASSRPPVKKSSSKPAPAVKLKVGNIVGALQPENEAAQLGGKQIEGVDHTTWTPKPDAGGVPFWEPNNNGPGNYIARIACARWKCGKATPGIENVENSDDVTVKPLRVGHPAYATAFQEMIGLYALLTEGGKVEPPNFDSLDAELIVDGCNAIAKVNGDGLQAVLGGTDGDGGLIKQARAGLAEIDGIDNHPADVTNVLESLRYDIKALPQQ